MRKFFLALAVLLGGLAAVAAPAGAWSASPAKIQGNGRFSGTSSFDFNVPCEVAHQVFDGTYKKGGAAGSFHIDGCDVDGPAGFVGFVFSGTAAVTTSAGTVLSGTVSGVVGGTPDLAFTLDLSGAGGATTTVQLNGTWVSSEVPGVPGPISGTLSNK
jgi:hypothetical protein